MFERFHKRKIDRLADAALDYLEDVLAKQTEEESSGDFARYSVADPGLYQQTGKHAQFSERDNYDVDSVDTAIRSLYSFSFSSPQDSIRALKESTDMSFVDKLLDFIDTRHMRDSDVYKAAQIDRRLFSKIVSDRSYKPAKDTCIALALALRLTLSDANDFLSRAGYVLSHSTPRDIVIEYFFREHIYDLNDINEVLFTIGDKPLGR